MSDVLLLILQIVETAVIITSLIIIYAELREGHRIAASNSNQAITEASISFYSTIAQNEDLTRIYMAGRKNPSDLQTTQRAQFFFLCVQRFLLIEAIFLQNEKGILPEEYFRGWKTDLQDSLKEEGFKWYWSIEGKDYSNKFRAYVDNIITSQGDLKDQVDLMESRVIDLLP